MGIYYCLGKGGEIQKRWETGKNMKIRCMDGALLGYKKPHRSRVVGTACLPHRLPLSLLKAQESFGWGGVAYRLGRKWDVFFRGS